VKEKGDQNRMRNEKNNMKLHIMDTEQEDKKPKDVL